MDERARAQIEILRQLQALFSTHRVRWWLRGGWAIDFMLGRITRPHADIDIVIWVRHRRRVRQALLDAGFDLLHEQEKQTDFSAQGEELSLAYLKRRPDGQIEAHDIPGWLWPEQSLGRRLLQLEGIAARVVGPRQLLMEKESYERGTGRPLRPKDVKSMETLRQIIAAGPIPG